MQMTSKVCPGDETTKVELWSGGWKMKGDEIVPDLRLMPIGKTITGPAGVGHWLTRGYKLPEDIPTNDDGSYRAPPGVMAEMRNEQKEIAKFINDELNKKPDEKDETLNKIVDLLTVMNTRIENLENAKSEKNKSNGTRLQKRVSSKKTTRNKRGDGDDKKDGDSSGEKRRPSRRAGDDSN